MPLATRPRVLVLIARLILLAVLCVIAWVAFSYGISLRRWAWDQTDQVHFYPDMNNGVHWGSQGNEPADHPRGFLNVYDLVAGSAGTTGDDQPDYRLDYAPLRLLLITSWQRWAAQRYPDVMEASVKSGESGGNPPWHPPFSFYAPLLRFNEGTEIAGAIGLFLLARHWVLRGDRRWLCACPAGTWGAVIRPFRGCGAGLLAGLLFWFSPAAILSTHSWPTWDEWIIPFFVWTLWFCCINWWFTAGVVLAVGAMFKGQQLFVAPMFILWPLLIGRPFAALRWVAGLLLAVSLIASPWLLSYVPGGVTENTTPADRLIDRGAVCFVIAVLVLIAVPVACFAWAKLRPPRPEPEDAHLANRLSRLIDQIAPWLKPVYGPIVAIIISTALLLCARWFHGSLNWLYIGWGYGTRHYMNMTMGLSDNLAGLLSQRFGWDSLRDIVSTDHPSISIRVLLVLLYGIALLICIVGMAIQYRRNDPRFLVAATGAWLMFFTFLPQIHERYLLYAAGVGCSLTAVSAAFVLFDLFMTVLTFIMTLHVMLITAAGNGHLRLFAQQISPTFSRTLFRVISHTFPDAGWAVLLVAAIFLYCAIAPSPAVRSRV